MSFDDNFINAWYEASKNDAPQFTINNVNYLTKGGRVAK
jgi:fatty acid-binding protein DegV